MFFKRKNKISKQRRLSWEETVELMQYQGLQYENGEVVKVLFNPDKTHRCVITKSPEGSFSYDFETLEAYDEQWLRSMPADKLPAYWFPCHCSIKSSFSDMEILMRELEADPEYKIHFNVQTDSAS